MARRIATANFYEQDLKKAVIRFWSKVEKTDSCWNWNGAVNGTGYGSIYSIGTGLTMAHRFSYMLTHGEVPEGLTIDHLCRNRRCVNPAHLEAVDHRTNCLRGTGMSSRNASKTHCNCGRPFDIITSQGARGCRTCRNARQRLYNQRNKEVVNARDRARWKLRDKVKK